MSIALRLACALALCVACAGTGERKGRHTFPSLTPADTDPALGFESPPVLRASELHASELLRGPHHGVEEEVLSDGFLLLYRVRSDYGAFDVAGDEMLKKRVKEIRAIAELRELESHEGFEAAARRAEERPFVARWNLVREPADTALGLPEAAWAELLETDATELDDRGEPEHRALHSYLRFEATKREIAAHLGVDPYSHNGVLQRELNRAAVVVFAGELPLAALDPGGRAQKGVVHPFVDEDVRLAQLLGRDSPEDLRRLNRIELAVMGIPPELASRALQNRWLTPRHRTIVMASLVAIEGARNRRAVVEALVLANTETDALVYQRNTEMLRAIHERVSPIERLETNGRFVRAYLADGRRVTPVEVDLVAWTGPLARMIGDAAARDARGGEPEVRELWISGGATERARAEIEAAGFVLREHTFRHLDEIEAEALAAGGGTP